MAQVKTIHPIASISGAIIKEEGTYFRTRNGKTHVYKVVHPYKGQPSENQNTMRTHFGKCVHQASTILNDSQLREEWQIKYDAYLQETRKHPLNNHKKVTTLRGFIISQLYKKQH